MMMGPVSPMGAVGGPMHPGMAPPPLGSSMLGPPPPPGAMMGPPGISRAGPEGFGAPPGVPGYGAQGYGAQVCVWGGTLWRS